VLNENNIVTEHPLEVIIFSDEEGGLIGSLSIAGHLTTEDLKQVSQSGLIVSDGVKAIGGNPDSIQYVARKKGDIKAYLELHIEQGGILEKEQINIGVVQGIVGYR
jgi:N-carbamoyl-L-amino-acid hydrolase